MTLSPLARAALRMLAILACLPLFAQIMHAGPACAATRPGAAFQPTRFSVVATGAGPDVILIPGLGTSRAVWDGEVQRLQARYRLHLVQISGFAGQPAGPNAEGPVLAPTMEELHAYITANHLKSPVVIGHSLGGLLGLMLAEAHPGDVGRLMVVDSFPFIGAAFDPTATVAKAEPQAAAMRDGVIAQSPETFSASEDNAVARLALTPAARQSVKGWVMASDRGVLARATYDDMTTDVRPNLSAITAPVTVLYPYDVSMGAPTATVDGIYAGAYAGLAGVKLKRMEGAYHFLMLDQPDAFAGEVDAFLN